MTDDDLLEKRLAYVVDSVERLRVHARPERLLEDPVQLGFVEHTLQTAIQAMLDVASSVVSSLHLGEPRTNAELFDRLASAGWIPSARVEVYRRIVGFRNILVHRYVEVDPAVVRSILDRHVDDLLAFVREVRGRPRRAEG